MVILGLGDKKYMQQGTTGSKIVQKGLTFPTALSVFIAPLLTYGMPDGGYKYGDTIRKYNDIVGNANNTNSNNNNNNSSSIITKIKGNESDNKTNSYTEYLIKLLEVNKNEDNK